MKKKLKREKKENFKLKIFFILTFIFLITLLLSNKVFSDATLYVDIYKNNNFFKRISTGQTITCDNYGSLSGTTNWGSYNDCKTNGQGTYTYKGYIQGTLSCTQNYAPPTTASGSNVIFCSAPDCSRTVSGFCDTTKPGKVSFSPSSGWYNNNFVVRTSYSDNYKVYKVIYGYKKSSSTSYTPSSSSCSSFGTSCSSTITISTSTCNLEGYNTCNVRAKSLDYWNEESSYSYTSYSIDFTPPKEPTITIDDSNPYVYYDANTNTLYYTNNKDLVDYQTATFTITVSVEDDTSKTNEVSGIYSINFPDFFDTNTGKTYTYGTFRTTLSKSRIQMHTYTISSTSTNQGTLTITVMDSAGNIITKNINVVLDNQPPQNVPPINTLLQYGHQIVNYDNDTIIFNLYYGSTSDTGVGLGHSNIYVVNARGLEDPNYKNPYCDSFQAETFSKTQRILENIPITQNNIIYYDSSTSQDFLKNGFCHKFYIEVCDKINNCVRRATTADQNVYGQDSTRGILNPENSCTVFGYFDNCNNRSKYFNNKIAYVSPLIGDCSGSCVGGKVEYMESNEILPSYNNKVEVLSREEFYDYTDKNGIYRIYNITPIVEYQLRAYPNSTQILLGEKKTPIYPLEDTQNILGNNVNIVIDNIDILLGLDFSLCTDSCTLKTDPFGTCYSQCSDSNFVDCAKDENGNIDNEKLAYLQACNGKRIGTRILNPNNPSEYIECCQGPVIPKIDNKVKLKVEDADNILKTERVVYYKGRLVRLVVTVFK